MTMTLYKNTTWTRRLTVRDASGVRYPLTAATIDAVVSEHISSPSLVTLTEGNGITQANQSTSPGVADLVITPDKIDSLPAGNYVLAVGCTIGGNRQYVVKPQWIVIR